MKIQTKTKNFRYSAPLHAHKQSHTKSATPAQNVVLKKAPLSILYLTFLKDVTLGKVGDLSYD